MENATFDPETHVYTFKGSHVPSCTETLQIAGLVNFDHVSEELLERKSELGREVHRARYLDDIGRLQSHDPQLTPYLDAWRLFRKESGFTPSFSEVWTVAEIAGMHYGMQIDAIGLIDRRQTVVDLKIGEIYPHHGIQLAGYAAGFHHAMLNSFAARFRTRRRAVVQLRSDGSYRLKFFEDSYDLEVFIAGLRIATWKRERKIQ